MCSLATLANALSVEHHLEVELLPAQHKLIGLDRMIITTGEDESLSFRLSEKARHISVEINGANREFNRQSGWLHVPLKSAEKKVGDITAATYFLTPDEQLAAAYLEATATYLKFYADLFGPYPFRKFAVVENFFPTGCGFPSYTLLGSTVLRLPFIIHTSLGHEIAHCWWGNGGYDKGVMVFHMLRKKLGDDAFWGALRDIYSQRRFQRTSWMELQQAFEKRSNRSLQTFFGQWVYRKGAPRFYLDGVSAESAGNEWKVRGRIVQKKPYYTFSANLLLADGSQEQLEKITVGAHRVTIFEIDSPLRPRELVLDPGMDIMRQLFESEIPPAINSLKSSPSVLFILTENVPPPVKEAARLLAHRGIAANSPLGSTDKLKPISKMRLRVLGWVIDRINMLTYCVYAPLLIRSAPRPEH